MKPHTFISVASLLFLGGPGPLGALFASGVHLNVHTHSGSLNSSGSASPKNRNKRSSEDFTYTHTHTHSQHGRLKNATRNCEKRHDTKCIFRLQQHTRTFAVGHAKVKRENTWSGERYFMLDLDKCILTYNKYTNIIEGKPWKTPSIQVNDTGLIELVQNHEPNKIIDLTKAYREVKNDMLVFTPKNRSSREFNNGNKFSLKACTKTKDKSHHYPDFGTDNQLYPWFHALESMTRCHSGASKYSSWEVSVPEDFKTHMHKVLKDFEQKKEPKGAKALAPYKKFKKLMCLIDVPRDGVELGARTIAMSYWRSVCEGDYVKAWSYVLVRGNRELCRLEKEEMKGLNNDFTTPNLLRTDLARSDESFNREARISITKYLQDGTDKSLIGWAGVLAKSVYRNMWLLKYDPNNFIPEEDIIPEQPEGLLYRGYRHDQKYVDSLYQEAHKPGAFSFEYIAGFTPQYGVAAKFMMFNLSFEGVRLERIDHNSKYNHHVFYIIAGSSMIRPLLVSKFDQEIESIVLPEMPLTVAYIKSLKDYTEEDLRKLKGIDTDEVIRVAKTLPGFIAHSKFSDTALSKVHLVILEALDIDFLDPHYPALLSDAEWQRFNALGIKTKKHFCEGEAPEESVPEIKDVEKKLDECFDNIGRHNAELINQGLKAWNKGRVAKGLKPDSHLPGKKK